MPLVFAVLIIIVLILNARDYSKNRSQRSARYAKDMRKTNAKLEQRVMDTFMKRGLSADEAFKKSYEYMISAGYEPCIPRTAYAKNSSFCKGLYKDFDPEYYDSFAVRDRRNDLREEWHREHPDDVAIDNELIESLLYVNFPKTEFEYVHDIKRRGKKAQAEPIGSFIIYPTLGTCEVLAHNWIGDGAAGGTYTLKVLKTGQIVTHVKIGDNKIRRQW